MKQTTDTSHSTELNSGAADSDAFDVNDREAPQADEYGPKRSADVIPFRQSPKDRLPCPFFGSPPLASLYHTKRADSARQRAEADVPEELAVARQELFAAGLRRGNPAVADVADHNAMTLAWALRYAALGGMNGSPPTGQR